jgi:hypothetical protein
MTVESSAPLENIASRECSGLSGAPQTQTSLNPLLKIWSCPSLKIEASVYRVKIFKLGHYFVPSVAIKAGTAVAL